jgi:predicted  nucleic acid-binding Zn-ribbon protein
LASQNTQTTASYTEMKAIIDQLNADVPGLGLTYDGVTESVDATVEAIKKAAKAQADSEYKAEQQQTYVDLLKEQSSLEQQIAEAEANLDAERQRRGMRQDDVTGDWVSGSGFWMEDSPWVAWTSDIDDYKKSLEELQAAYDENQQTLSDIEGEWRGVAQAVEDAQNQTVTYDEAVSMATSSAQSALDELTAAYDKAYESARTSIEGQIGLFDTMKTSSELSISDMEKAMQSQTDYLNLYSENLKKAAEYGLDDGLIKSLSDGSEESAGYINAIIQNIEKLGGSTEGMPAAASKFVDEFNSKFEETEKAKDAFADNIAKMETDFDKTMSDIEQTMTGTVEKMEMADEAKEAAQATIKAYCDAIRSMTGEAGSAAEAVANAAASHLKTAPTTTPTATTVTGHANGTLSAQEDVYIAGEKGPELIIGARGSEVFPTQETERILAAVNSAENATNAPEPELPTDVPATPFAAAALPEPTASPLPENDLPEGMEAVKEYSYLTADGQGSDAQPTGIEYVEPEVQAQTTEEAAPAEEAPVNTTAPAASDAQQEAPASSSDAPSIGETVKRIILEINGSGSIDVGGMNEESVLDILTRHVKPVLMSIIKGEIFEEGDLAYDF